MPPPRIGITWLKRFHNKRPTIGPVKKSSSIERRESGGAFGVKLFVFFFMCIFNFISCLYIEVHFVNLKIDKYLLSIY